MKVSVIIPTYREQFIELAVRSVIDVAEREGLDYEVIVVTSTETPEYWLEHLGVKLLQSPKHKVGEARNIGAMKATGDVLLFMDANSIILQGLESISEYAVEPWVGEVTAPVHVLLENGKVDKSLVGWSPEMDKTLEYVGWGCMPKDMTKPYRVMFACGCLAAIDKKKFDMLPVKWIPYWGYEDREIGMRLWRMGYENIGIPWARFAHNFKKTLVEEKLNDPIFYKTYAKNYAIGALLDFDDDTLMRLMPVLRSKGVTEEIWNEVMSEGWNIARYVSRRLYRRGDVEYFLSFGKNPP